MITGGKGGSKTQTGLLFESRISLSKAINQLEGYQVNSSDEVLYNGKKVAQLFTKNKLYKNLLLPLDVDHSRYISKKLLPDEAILIGKTLFIIEMKFQNVFGSVDEKLQTCDFKKKQYTKLLSPAGINVEYIYVLNDWFKKPEYKDVLDYINSVGCHCFFNELPLSFIGI